MEPASPLDALAGGGLDEKPLYAVNPRAKLASTEITVAKPPEDTRPAQEQWDDLVRRMIAAGAISLVPDDLIPEPPPILGLANPRGRGASTVNKDADGHP